MLRACDPCSIRKIKCNGKSPCDGCLAADLPCSHARKRKKPGPKGPRKRIKEVIQQMQTAEASSEVETSGSCGSELDTGASGPTLTTSDPPLNSYDNSAISGPIPLSTFNYYLDIFRSHLHVVWPVVDCDSIKSRLQDTNDRAVYALAAAICSATIAQLHLAVDGSLHSHHQMALEAESARFLLDYSSHETIDALLTSFFLHVFYSNTGKMTKSTLLLREAIAYSHILGLHQDIFYTNLDSFTTQYYLRIAWILFITDRAHSLQHDLPPTFKLSPTLPELQPQEDDGLSTAFCSLCRLFQSFQDACPPDIRSTGGRHLLGNISTQLRRAHPFPLCENEVQRADLVVTDSWLRVVLWKVAIPYVDSTTDPNDRGLSVSFPMSVAKDLLSKLATLSSCALEAHGPGMVSKLFEVASSVADVILCAPDLADVGSVQVGPREILYALSSLISSLRTTGHPELITLLREKMMACALDQAGPATLMQITDVSDEDAQNLVVPHQGDNR
ncbi:Zn(2)-C6 fungal-type domain-containing protein [Fusarium sp. Ph1]|nr:Zn(2)-C6 fungal-type domain-containing protein [Fusarium sp. Ph1]